MINTLLKSLFILVFTIVISCSSTKIHTSKNEDIVKSYINARNNYDVEKVTTLVDENYTETFVDGSIEIENKGQLAERILWGKEMDSRIELLEIKTEDNGVITIEEYTNYLDIALKRKSRKFKMVYTLGDGKIRHQKIDTLSGYHQVLEFNFKRYQEFEKYCTQNGLNYKLQSTNKGSGVELRKVLEKYKSDHQ